MCIIKFIISGVIIVCAIIIEVSWLAICFGSVLLGVILLIFAPHILFLPFTLGITLGGTILSSCKN